MSEGPHDWYRPRQYAYPICRICGVVRRRDGKNKPCKGPTCLRPMEGEIQDGRPVPTRRTRA